MRNIRLSFAICPDAITRGSIARRRIGACRIITIFVLSMRGITIKLKYRTLAMKHHPDRNQGCPKSEELLKQINMAYTVLKMAYEKFDKLPDDKK